MTDSEKHDEKTYNFDILSVLKWQSPLFQSHYLVYAGYTNRKFKIETNYSTYRVLYVQIHIQL